MSSKLVDEVVLFPAGHAQPFAALEQLDPGEGAEIAQAGDPLGGQDEAARHQQHGSAQRQNLIFPAKLPLDPPGSFGCAGQRLVVVGVALVPLGRPGSPSGSDSSSETIRRRSPRFRTRVSARMTAVARVGVVRNQAQRKLPGRSVVPVRGVFDRSSLLR